MKDNMANVVHLEDNEKVLYTARKHWFIFVAESFFTLILALVPLVIFIVPENLRQFLVEVLHFGGNREALFLLFWSLWILALWIVFVICWTDYYFDVWYVTDHRIIDVEQEGLFSRKISSFRFDQIQDVTVEVSGLLATLIGFGTVKISTAGEETFIFQGVAHPHFLKDRIMTEHHRVHDDSRVNSAGAA